MDASQVGVAIKLTSNLRPKETCSSSTNFYYYTKYYNKYTFSNMRPKETCSSNTNFHYYINYYNKYIFSNLRPKETCSLNTNFYYYKNYYNKYHTFLNLRHIGGNFLLNFFFSIGFFIASNKVFIEAIKYDLLLWTRAR